MKPEDIMEQMRHAFRAEALDRLIELDSALLALESEPGDLPLVHRVFRAIHTIKGSGATAGCVHLARFAHGMEGAFDLAREGRLERPAATIAIYLRSLKTLTAASRYRESPELVAPITTQLEVLDAALLAGVFVSDEDQSVLATAFTHVCALLDNLRTKVGGVGSAGVSGKAQASPQPDLAETPAGRAVSVSPASTVRIDQNKLDRLMTIVGELQVARGAFPLLIQKINDGVQGATAVKDLKETEANISRIADELQSSVMSIRMLPVKTVFQRFPRLVRDLARSLRKEVGMVLMGESIELDKTIMEQIGDPLVHIIRNAVDHGLEMPEGRRAAGKDPSGQVC